LVHEVSFIFFLIVSNLCGFYEFLPFRELSRGRDNLKARQLIIENILLTINVVYKRRELLDFDTPT
jgi:hypothetical protein